MVKEYEKARAQAPEGVIGFNIMVALQHYKEYVMQAAKIGADIIISGAGLATELPAYVKGFAAKIVPIVSGERAAEGFKQKYVEATREEIQLVANPVGMLGRAIRNGVVERVEAGVREPITRCYGCLRKCNPAEIPYCITQALITSAKGDAENGLVFCGANTYKINKISTVQEVIENLFQKC